MTQPSSTVQFHQKQEYLIIVALSLCVILLRLPSLELPFDNDSGANAYHARLISSHEPLYSSHHPGHHLPAVYYTYALAFFLFGDSVWSVKFFLILWNIAATYLLYRLGATLMDKATGFLAAIFFAVLSAHVWLWGTTAEIELFANLPRIAVFLVLTYLVTHQAPAWKFFFVGLLSLIIFMFKAIYLSPLVLTGLALWVEWWQTRKATHSARLNLWRGLWVGIGFISGLSFVLAYFAWLGLLSRFTLIFTIGSKYINLYNTNSAGPEYWLLYPTAGLGMNNAILLIFSLAGLVIILTDHYRKTSWPRFYLAAWYFFSFIEAGLNRAFFPHYYLLIVPPLALLAAHFAGKIYRGIRSLNRNSSTFVAPFTLTLLLAASLYLSIQQNFNFYNQYVRYKLGFETYDNFLATSWPNEGIRLLQLQQVAEYLKHHTSSADYIYYWSEDVQLYYMAERRCPIDIIWPVYAQATGPYQRIFVPQTKYIVISYINSIPRPSWLYAELVDNYTLELTIEDQEIYRRKSF